MDQEKCNSESNPKRFFKVPEIRPQKSNSSKNMKAEMFPSIEKTWQVSQRKRDSPGPLPQKTWSKKICARKTDGIHHSFTVSWNTQGFASCPCELWKQYHLTWSLNARAGTCITIHKWHKSAEKHPGQLKLCWKTEPEKMYRAPTQCWKSACST